VAREMEAGGWAVVERQMEVVVLGAVAVSCPGHHVVAGVVATLVVVVVRCRSNFLLCRCLRT
jgi:hypothetical protein